MNHNFSLLRTLYSSTFDKYIKFKTRLDKARQSGRFFTLSKSKQHSLVQRLQRLYEKLKSLQTQLRVSGIGAAIALALSAGSAEAQTVGPFQYNPAENPLPSPHRVAIAKPTAVDIDNDGDLDVFVGDKYGNIHFFRNTAGKDQVRRFIKEENNQFPSLDIGTHVALAFADVDGDGDFDAIVGNRQGYTYFFRNTGTVTNPVFQEQTGASNPFNGITGSVGYSRGPAAPSFVDIDGDSDLDLIIGSDQEQNGKYSYAPALKIYKNAAGVFTAANADDFSPLFYYEGLNPVFADIDADGDLDVITGTISGVVTFINTGTTAAPVLEPQEGPWNPDTHTGNPLHNAYIYANPSPFLADFDDDGDLDLLVGFGYNFSSAENSSPIAYFENTEETDGDFILVRKSGLQNTPFDGVDVGNEATPSFSDIDGDGDLDAVLGNKYSLELRVFVNNDGYFEYDSDHPISDINMDLRTLPVFVDIDNDGDQDMFISDKNHVRFLENNNNTSFSEDDSPLSIPGSFYNISLAFIDVDSDGDFDALVFNHDTEAIEFFRNTGNRTNPAFTQQTAPAPFDDIEFSSYVTKLRSVDIDHDGDLDLVVSESITFGKYYFTAFSLFENNGDETFTAIDASFPIQIIDDSEEAILAEPYSIFSTADMDGDGDLDLVIGRGDGTVDYYENINIAPVTQISSSSVLISDNSATVLDPDLTISDDDADQIVRATVTIGDYLVGEERLNFTPANGISGEFDEDEGVLTLRGKASEEEYETVLRTVTYRYTGSSSARKGSSSAVQPPPIQKAVEFQVRDTDFTLTTVSVVNLSITAEPIAGIVVYNAVSPNGDDFNSYMRIEGLGGSKNKVTIYNRWGDQVFETTQYDNTDNRFEGKNKDGKLLPGGTYYYKIEASGKTLTGYLSLKR